jgi:hypothetical protein
LVNGLSRNITRPGRIALGEDIKHKAKPIRGIIVGNSVEQQNNESQQQPSNSDQQIVPQKASSEKISCQYLTTSIPHFLFLYCEIQLCGILGLEID